MSREFPRRRPVLREVDVQMEANLVIDPEFKALLRPLSEEVRKGLEQDMLRDGCRDPLVVWRRENGDRIVLDGHHRIEVCLKHDLRFSIIELSFPSREHAMRWIVKNQLDRRNLNKNQRALLAAQAGNLPAHRPSKESAQICGVDQDAAATTQGLSRRTVQHTRRLLKHGSPKLREAFNRNIIAPSVASNITRLPQEEQERIAEQCLERGDAEPARAAASNVVRGSNRAPADTSGMDERHQFAVVLADPWRPEPTPVLGDREVTNHRCLLAANEIKTVGTKLRQELLPNAVLFLRAPPPLIEDALSIIKTWGFYYWAQIVCLQPGAGSDDYVLYDHQLLLIGARGSDLLPGAADRPNSVINDEPYLIIDHMFPKQPKLALFADIRRPGWTSWDYPAPKAIKPLEEDVDLD